MKEMVYSSTMSRRRDVLEDNYYKGYHYVVLSFGTHPCGYVEVPKGNKLYGLNMDSLPYIDCHGGVTYTRSYLGLDNNSKAYKDSWFIGWHYAHYMDYVGGLFVISDFNDKKWTTAEIVDECKSVIEQLIIYEKE